MIIGYETKKMKNESFLCKSFLILYLFFYCNVTKVGKNGFFTMHYFVFCRILVIFAVILNNNTITNNPFI